MSDYGLFVEIGLAVLLLLTIVYCWRLDPVSYTHLTLPTISSV